MISVGFCELLPQVLYSFMNIADTTDQRQEVILGEGNVLEYLISFLEKPDK
jgi:hypothetical protein